jgi:hypothetical protein
MATRGSKAGKHESDAFPVRGCGLGWRDVWDSPDLDTAVLRLVAAQLEARERATVQRVRRDMQDTTD